MLVRNGYRTKVRFGGLMAALLLLTVIQHPAIAQEGRINSPGSSSGPYQGFGYPWENNDLGISPEVPAPWTALAYRQNTVSCWGREFSFANGVLPVQIRSQGHDLFAGRPELTIMIDGKNIAKGLDTQPTFTQQSRNRAAYQLKYQEDSYRIEMTGSLEYDGLLQIDLVISPKKPVKLNQISLYLPYKKDVAAFFNRNLNFDVSSQKVRGKDLPESFGRLGDSVQMRFNPALWVGNHDVGIEWICETNANWSNENPEKAIQFLPANDKVALRIDVVSKPLNIQGDYVLSFGLYPTPVKSLPADWRSYILINAAPKPPAFNTATRKIYGIAWPEDMPYRGLPILKGSGKSEGASSSGSSKIMAEHRAMQRLGIGFIPYGALYGMSSHLPLGEWKNYGVFWSAFGKQASSNAPQSSGTSVEEPRRTKGGFSYVCPFAKSFRDFLVWQYVQAIEKFDIDGMYLDLAAPGILCQNQNHPHGPVVERGYEYYPFFLQRKLMQRLYIACKAKKPAFLISVHHSKVPVICSGFADLVVSGEPLQTLFKKKRRILKLGNKDASAYVPDYSDLPDWFFEIEYSQRRGFISMLLPEIIKRNEQLMKARPDLLKYYTRTLLTRAVVYDIPLSAKRMDLESYNNVLKAQERFGWVTGASYNGPWESGKYLRGGGPRLKLALYLQPQDSKLMLVAANFSDQDAVEEISLNLEELKKSGLQLQGRYRVTDLLEARPYPSENGRMKLSVPAQDFRMLMVQ